MPDQKLLNKAITISAKEEKLQGGKAVVKIKDEKGLTYTVYKLKQDGTESIAWGQLSELNLNDTVQIGFVEDLGEYEGKTVTYRTIRNFNKDIGEGMANHQAQAESSRGGENIASQGSSDDKFWDKKAYKQCLWAYWLKNAPSYVNATQELIPVAENLVWRVFKQIEADAEKRFSEPKLIDPAENLNVADIPF